MKSVFRRNTANNKALECFIENTEVVFNLDGKRIRPQSIVGIDDIESLAKKPWATDLYQTLHAAGATHVWNLQVALYDDEADRIKAALTQAHAELEIERQTRIANTDIVVTKLLYNGAPAMAENDRFSWHFLQESFLLDKIEERAIYQMAYMRKQGMGSDEITDPDVVEAVRRFWDDLHLLQDDAEKRYEAKQAEKEKQEIKAFFNSPLVRGLSHAEIEHKAREYDEIHNEGGEGFNPYRMAQ